MDELIRFAKAHKGQIKKLAKKVRRSAIEARVETDWVRRPDRRLTLMKSLGISPITSSHRLSNGIRRTSPRPKAGKAGKAEDMEAQEEGRQPNQEGMLALQGILVQLPVRAMRNKEDISSSKEDISSRHRTIRRRLKGSTGILSRCSMVKVR